MKLGNLLGALGIAAASAMLVGAGSARAQDNFPNQPIKIVVPYTPGAINDVLARAMGAALSEELDETIIIENRPGAGSVIGTNHVAKAAPDGHTILQVPAAFAINAALRDNLPYDSEDAFEFVTVAATSPFLLVVNAKSGIESVQDLVAKAKAKPGAMQYASTGPGGNAHMMAEMLLGLAQIDVLHVPYKGLAQATTDLVGGQVDFTFSTYTGASAVLKGGQVRALGITSRAPSASFPDLKPIAEQGFPGYNAVGWWAYAVPKGTPAPVVAKLNAAINKVLADPEFAKRFAAEGLDIVGTSPESARQFVQDDISTWRRVVKDFDIEKLGG